MERVEDFPFVSKTGQPRKYDYDKLLNGETWKFTMADLAVTKGKSLEAARAAIRNQGRKRGLRVQTSLNDNCLYVKAVTDGPVPN